VQVQALTRSYKVELAQAAAQLIPGLPRGNGDVARVRQQICRARRTRPALLTTPVKSPYTLRNTHRPCARHLVSTPYRARKIGRIRPINERGPDSIERGDLPAPSDPRYGHCGFCLLGLGVFGLAVTYPERPYEPGGLVFETAVPCTWACRGPGNAGRIVRYSPAQVLVLASTPPGTPLGSTLKKCVDSLDPPCQASLLLLRARALPISLICHYALRRGVDAGMWWAVRLAVRWSCGPRLLPSRDRQFRRGLDSKIGQRGRVLAAETFATLATLDIRLVEKLAARLALVTVLRRPKHLAWPTRPRWQSPGRWARRRSSQRVAAFLAVRTGYGARRSGQSPLNKFSSLARRCQPANCSQ